MDAEQEERGVVSGEAQPDANDAPQDEPTQPQGDDEHVAADEQDGGDEAPTPGPGETVSDPPSPESEPESEFPGEGLPAPEPSAPVEDAPAPDAEPQEGDDTAAEPESEPEPAEEPGEAPAGAPVPDAGRPDLGVG